MKGNDYTESNAKSAAWKTISLCRIRFLVNFDRILKKMDSVFSVFQSGKFLLAVSDLFKDSQCMFRVWQHSVRSVKLCFFIVETHYCSSFHVRSFACTGILNYFYFILFTLIFLNRWNHWIYLMFTFQRDWYILWAHLGKWFCSKFQIFLTDL